MAEKLADVGRNTLSANDYLLLQRELIAAQREIDSATGRKRAILKRAKDQGADLDAIATLRKLARMDDDDRMAMIATMTKYAEWEGVPLWRQAGIFGDDDADESGVDMPSEAARQAYYEAKALDAGIAAFRNKVPLDDNPHTPGGPMHERWVVGWRNAEAAAGGLPEGVTMASTRRKKDKVLQVAAPVPAPKVVEPEPVTTVPEFVVTSIDDSALAVEPAPPKRRGRPPGKKSTVKRKAAKPKTVRRGLDLH